MNDQTNNKPLNYLIVSPRISLQPFPQNLENYVHMPAVPMGLAYISACMKSVSNNVCNLNLEFEVGDIFGLVNETIRKQKIDVVFTGGMSGQFSKIKLIVDAVKRTNENIKVVVGGSIMSSVPEVAMKALENVDIGVIGEGDITSMELVKALDSGADLKNIEGLAYKNGNNLTVTKPRKEIQDLDALPFPDYEGLACEEVWEKNQVFYIVCSRSCPFNCTFCYHPCGKRYRRRSIDNIMGEIDYLAKKYKIKQLGPLDELFSCDRNRLIDFCNKIKKYNLKWGCTVHASKFYPELLDMMRESGCKHINIGVESASDKILKSMNKRTTIKQIEYALEKIRDARIGVNATLIFGDIEEDASTVEETITWWRNHLQYFIELTRIYVYPGSHIYKYAVESGIIKDEIAHMEGDCRDANVSHLTEQEYNEMLLRLTTEEAFYCFSPEKYSILSVDTKEARTSFKYQCACGTKESLSTSGLLLSGTFRCPECHQAYRISFAEKYSMPKMLEKINELLIKYKKIAFWGLGREIQILLKGIEASKIDGLFVIDADKKKQGLSFLGHKVNTPDILTKEEIGAVIPTPLLGGGIHYTESIENVISKIKDVDIISLGEIIKGKTIDPEIEFS